MAGRDPLSFGTPADERKAQALMVILEGIAASGQPETPRVRASPRDRKEQPGDQRSGTPAAAVGFTQPPGWDEDSLRAVLESVPDAIIAADGRGTIVLVNRQTEDLFGYDRSELLGRPVELLIPERFRVTHVEQRQRYFDNPQV